MSNLHNDMNKTSSGLQWPLVASTVICTVDSRQQIQYMSLLSVANKEAGLVQLEGRGEYTYGVKKPATFRLTGQFFNHQVISAPHHILIAKGYTCLP